MGMDDPLIDIHRLVYRVAADLAAFAGASPVGPGELAQARDALLRLAQKLDRHRAAYVAEQLGRLHLPRDARDLQICLTGRAPAPWLNVGLPPADLAINLAWGIPLPEASARYVYFALALEHFFYRADAQAILAEVRRVLRAGGVLRVVVPDIEKYVRAYVAGDREFFDRHRQFWAWAHLLRTPMEHLQLMSGSGQGRGPSDFFAHKNGYDYETLSLLLRDAGFTSVARSEYLHSEHEGLAIDGVSHDAGFGSGGQNFNLFVEAC